MPDSRWSCKPDLGSAGSTCSITYALPDPQYIEELNIGEFFVYEAGIQKILPGSSTYDKMLRRYIYIYFFIRRKDMTCFGVYVKKCHESTRVVVDKSRFLHY